jgi:hypothetical protein
MMGLCVGNQSDLTRILVTQLHGSDRIYVASNNFPAPERKHSDYVTFTHITLYRTDMSRRQTEIKRVFGYGVT